VAPTEPADLWPQLSPSAQPAHRRRRTVSAVCAIGACGPVQAVAAVCPGRPLHTAGCGGAALRITGGGSVYAAHEHLQVGGGRRLGGCCGGVPTARSDRTRLGLATCIEDRPALAPAAASTTITTMNVVDRTACRGIASDRSPTLSSVWSARTARKVPDANCLRAKCRHCLHRVCEPETTRHSITAALGSALPIVAVNRCKFVVNCGKSLFRHGASRGTLSPTRNRASRAT